jgi:hypothetical protein
VGSQPGSKWINPDCSVPLIINRACVGKQWLRPERDYKRSLQCAVMYKYVIQGPPMPRWSMLFADANCHAHFTRFRGSLSAKDTVATVHTRITNRRTAKPLRFLLGHNLHRRGGKWRFDSSCKVEGRRRSATASWAGEGHLWAALTTVDTCR